MFNRNNVGCDTIFNDSQQETHNNVNILTPPIKKTFVDNSHYYPKFNSDSAFQTPQTKTTSLLNSGQKQNIKLVDSGIRLGNPFSSELLRQKLNQNQQKQQLYYITYYYLFIYPYIQDAFLNSKMILLHIVFLEIIFIYHFRLEIHGEQIKTCNCKQSKCLKFYCECFASGSLCSPKCGCTECSNNNHYLQQRNQKIEQLIEKNPDAFNQKVKTNIIEQKLRHSKGCNCRKSGCQKKYCECFNSGVECSDQCNCDNCKNNKGSLVSLLTKKDTKFVSKVFEQYGRAEQQF